MRTASRTTRSRRRNSSLQFLQYQYTNHAMSLREALIEADSVGGPSRIDIAVSGTLNLSGTIPIDADVDIVGPGAASFTISGNNTGLAFEIDPGYIVSLSGVSIVHSGIENFGTLSISDSSLLNNAAPLAGAVTNHAGATLSIEHVLFAANSAGQGGH